MLLKGEREREWNRFQCKREQWVGQRGLSDRINLLLRFPAKQPLSHFALGSTFIHCNFAKAKVEKVK